ncbi:MAG: arginase [Bacteroidia bacterium]|jgi:arginase|nr:MAG: arginase [Bacteroidia bacterium]
MHKRQNKIIHFFEVKSELGAGTYGASLGIDAIHFASIQHQLNIFENNPIKRIEAPLEWNFEHGKNYEYAYNIDAIIKIYEQIVHELTQLIEKDYFPFIIGGDHSFAGASIKAIRQAYPDKRLGVIWIDAHADLHSPFTTPSGNLHGMPLATVLEVEKITQPLNHVSEQEMQQWNYLCNLGGDDILFEDLVYIALRDCEQPEWDIIHKTGIQYFPPEEIQRWGIETIAQNACEYLEKCDLIYVSFDVDSMDPSVSTGTGTPVKNGLSLEQAKTLLNYLWKSPKLSALELVEVNPLLDCNNTMATIAANIIAELVHSHF